MKAVMVMFDSLNRRFLPNYGCDLTLMPNFKRLGEKTVTFDRCYAGSLPCIPARRELHTGRYNFLHRSWGPIEPYDDSMPEILHMNHIHSHLATDHYHYFEDGAATYHNRYQTWEAFRGQEGDPWNPVISFRAPEHLNQRDGGWATQDFVNRSFMANEEDMPQVQTFNAGLQFIEANHQSDNWFLHLETFDPHEPYFVPEKYRALYDDPYTGPLYDWPLYKEVTETPEEVKHLRSQYMALLSMCDHYLGTVLDAFDRYDLWKDTMLIVNTDHGFLLGEHGWWGKCTMPFFNEIVNIPLFIYDPRGGIQNERRQALVQTIDLAPTLLGLFDIEKPESMQGHDLAEVIKTDAAVRSHALFGIHGGAVNITDGEYVYMHYPNEANKPLSEFTLMPTRHGIGRAFINNNVLERMSLCEPFAFTKGIKLMQLPITNRIACRMSGTCLYDLKNDPGELCPIDQPQVASQMLEHLVRLMQENDAPKEQYERLALNHYIGG